MNCQIIDCRCIVPCFSLYCLHPIFLSISICWVLRTALFWVIRQRVVVIYYRNCGTAYSSHLQCWKSPLKMGPIGCPETSVRNYHYSLRNNTEERSSFPLRNGSFKSRLLGGYFLIACPISACPTLRPTFC